MFRHTVAVLACLVPLVAGAAPREINASCGQTVRGFFAPLIQQNLINPKPAHVSETSVNEFNPHLLKPLTAFGLPVVRVLGYTNDPLLFVTNTPSQDVYGVLVRDGIGNVQAHLSSIGETGARILRVDQKVTLILCKGEI